MSLHSTGESWARDLWDGWSRQSGKFDEGKQEKSWQSFSSDGTVRIASLFRLAKQQGWRPPRAPLSVKGQRPQARAVPDMTQNGSTPAPAAQQEQHGNAAGAISLPVGDPAAGLDTVSPCTHVANASRIAREYTDCLHYVLGRGWILWTGQFWRTDPTARW